MPMTLSIPPITMIIAINPHWILECLPTHSYNHINQHNVSQHNNNTNANDVQHSQSQSQQNQSYHAVPPTLSLQHHVQPLIHNQMPEHCDQLLKDNLPPKHIPPNLIYPTMSNFKCKIQCII